MRIELLDHGYVELVETWGSDERIIEAARMSTAKGFQGWGVVACRWCESTSASGKLAGHCSGGRGGAHEPITEGIGDEKLLRFLYENKHATPFEMAGLIVEVQAPIFVFREWHRHRTQSYNELSARYTPLPDLCYVPSVERLMASRQSVANKQGSAGGISEGDARAIQSGLRSVYANSRVYYETLLGAGVAREVARLVVPVAQYSRMRASANLRNWLAFLSLRTAPAAQWEIRQYANAVGEIVAAKFPRTWTLFEEGRAHA